MLKSNKVLLRSDNKLLFQKIKGRKITLKNKYILIGKIPFMTGKGTFIINGNTRVIVLIQRFYIRKVI